MRDEPHVPWGWERLKAARAAPRCGARARSTGCACRNPAMANGRCRKHGGKSRGPVTARGIERSRKARWVHGLYSRETIAARQEARILTRALASACRKCLA